MKKRRVIALIGVVSVAVIIAVLLGTRVNKESGESVNEESTESIIENIISSFGDEEETEVKNDAEAVYLYSTIDRNNYTEEELPEYMRKLQEEQATEQEETYSSPNFAYNIKNLPEQDYASVSISECTWYYIKDGTSVTVDGVTADNVPTGMYLCDAKVTGAKSLDEAPKLDPMACNTGYYIGGVNLPTGSYKIVQGYVSTSASYVGLQSYNGQITTKYAGLSNGSYAPDEDNIIFIAEGAYYYFNACSLQKVGG